IVGLRISRPGGAFEDSGAAAVSGAGNGFIRNAVGGHGIGSVYANDRNAMAKFSEGCFTCFENIENGKGLLCGWCEDFARECGLRNCGKYGCDVASLFKLVSESFFVGCGELGLWALVDLDACGA